jgi:hypothetical protein
MNSTRASAALISAALVATLSLTACVQRAEDTATPPSQTAQDTPAAPAGQPEVPARKPIPAVCDETMPEPAYQACIRNWRAGLPKPPVRYQHTAE